MQFPPIVMLTYNFFPDIGGVEIAVLNFAKVLAAAGHDVHVVVPIKKGRVPEERIDGIPVHRFPFDWDEALAALLHNQSADNFRSKVIKDIGSILERIGEPP